MIFYILKSLSYYIESFETEWGMFSCKCDFNCQVEPHMAINARFLAIFVLGQIWNKAKCWKIGKSDEFANFQEKIFLQEISWFRYDLHSNEIDITRLSTHV